MAVLTSLKSPFTSSNSFVIESGWRVLEQSREMDVILLMQRDTIETAKITNACDPMEISAQKTRKHRVFCLRLSANRMAVYLMLSERNLA